MTMVQAIVTMVTKYNNHSTGYSNHGYDDKVTMVTVENPLITLHWINIRIFRYYYEGVIRTMILMWERTMTYRDVVF